MSLDSLSIFELPEMAQKSYCIQNLPAGNKTLDTRLPGRAQNFLLCVGAIWGGSGCVFSSL